MDRRGASGGGAGGSILIRANSITGTTNPAASTAGTPVGTSATWAAAEDTLLNLAKSTLKRLRFEVSNEGTGAASGTTYRLEVSGPDPASCSAAAFSAVPTAATGHWQIVDSANLTGGAASTNVTPGLTDANPTFVPGRVMDTGNQTTGISLSTTEFTEIEFALQATANATDGALYCFRLTNAGATTNFTYVQYGQARLLGLDHFLVEAFGGGSIGTQTAGTPFSIRITAQDINNSTWTAFTGTVDITSTGTLSAGGGTTASFVGGVLASHSVTISNTGSFTITATRTSGTQTGTSNAFTVRAGAASQLVFVTQPSDGTAGVALPTQPVVEVRAALGNPVTTDPNGAATETVTVAFKAGTNGEGATLSGTLTVNINWATGRATYTNLSVNLAGNYQLTASTTLGAFTADSSAFNITVVCGGEPDAAYVAANAQNGQATVYWSSANPVLILRKSGTSITDAPTNGTSYIAGNTIGASSVATGYSVSVTFDHASMVAAGKSRADGGDVRVRYWNGASWVHLDRVLDEGSAWNTATTRIWFKTQAAISAATTDAVIEARARGRADVCSDCRHIGVGLRLSAAGAGYTAFGHDQGSTTLTLDDFSAWGTWVVYLGAFSQTLTADTWYRIKFQAIGTTLNAKAWQDGTAEPGWQVSTTDATYASGTGADGIQAPVAAQVRAWSDAAFKAAQVDDLLFVATRNTSSTNNKLFALRASDGSVAWTFNGSGTSNVDYIVGMPFVDYARNRVYVTSRAGAGAQSSLWVINSLTGALVQSFALGHLDSSPSPSYDGSTLYVGNTAGTLYAIDLNTLTQKWSLPVGGVLKGFVWEDWTTAKRLYFATDANQVRCVQDNGGSGSIQWTTAVTAPSTPLALDKLYVGSSDGKVHQLRLSDGVDEKQFTVGSGSNAVGDVSTETLSELFVPTTEGKLYKLSLPLP